MKSLIIIWLTVLVVLVGGTLYMNHEVNKLIQEIPKDSVRINHCDTSGMVVLTPSKCLVSGFNSLEVQSADPTQLQPKNVHYEDEVSMHEIAQPADYSKQTTRHWVFLQGQKRVYGENIIVKKHLMICSDKYYECGTVRNKEQ